MRNRGKKGGKNKLAELNAFLMVYWYFVPELANLNYYLIKILFVIG